MTHLEWWTTRETDGSLIVMHVGGEGAKYHLFFCLDNRETCPTCGKEVPACLILGSKIGAL